MTRQRAVVLEVIRQDKCHHTAEEIFNLAKEKLPGISRATVYNNLKALEAEEIIRKISGDGGGADRYDSSFIPHGHQICVGCGRVWDFDFPEFAEKLSSLIGRDVSSYELKVRTVCDECSSNMTAS